MNKVRRMATAGLLVTLGLVPGLLAIAIYAAIGLLAGIAGVLAAAVELAHSGATELVKRLPLRVARPA